MSSGGVSSPETQVSQSITCRHFHVPGLVDLVMIDPEETLGILQQALLAHVVAGALIIKALQQGALDTIVERLPVACGGEGSDVYWVYKVVDAMSCRGV